MIADGRNPKAEFEADILLVDDDPAAVRLVVDILEGAGYKVRPASDGTLALRSAKAKPPALVLLDIKLPTMSGFEVCKLLKADAATSSIPIIFVSALPDDHEKGKAFEQGAVDYIVKPIRKEELLARVKTHLDTVQATRALARERDRAQQYLDIAGVLIVALDVNAKVILINRKGSEVLGHEEAEILGKSWVEHFIPERNRKAVAEVFSQNMAGDLATTEYFENPVLCRNGEERLIAWHNSIVRDAAGAIVGTLSSGTDITERAAAESRLRASEDLFRTTLYSIGDAVMTTDRDGRVRMMNPVAEALTGWTDAEAHGKPLTEVFAIVNEETRASVADPVARVMRSGAVVGLANHTLLIARDKTERPIADSAAPIRDRSGEISGVVLVFRDQTEEQRAQAALRQSERQFRAIFESNSAAMAIIERDTTISMVNAEYCRVGGYEPQDVIGISWTSQIPPGDLERLQEYNRKRLSDPASAPDKYEFKFYRKDGEIRDCLMSVAILPGNQKILASFVDITERKRSQQEREQLQASLAQSDRLASMGTLAAGVAHEINNPLSYMLYNVESLSQDLPKLAAAIKRCSAGLREQVGDAAWSKIVGEGAALLQPAELDDAIDRAQEALSGANRIKAVARGLSTFSRVKQVEATQIDVRYAIESAVKMAANEIKYRAVLVKDLAEVPAIWASEGEVAQIFLNLLINAAQAIPEGDVDHHRISVRTYVADGDVVAEVSDTGDGIAPETLSRIFDPFFTTKEVGKGSGLGLAICRNLVTKLGGDIRVESEVGKGTRFVIRLPVTPKTAEQDQGAPSPEAAEVASIRGRILVVDDEPVLLATLKRLLGREHEVVVASSGREAQAILEVDRAFDLVLCDLMMPEMTGMDLHAWLVEHDAPLAAKVVFLTGGAFTPRASEYLASAGNLKVDKPFDADTLKKLVSTLVRGNRC
jgi:PAS domain S-box-containing protein